MLCSCPDAATLTLTGPLTCPSLISPAPTSTGLSSPPPLRGLHSRCAPSSLSLCPISAPSGADCLLARGPAQSAPVAASCRGPGARCRGRPGRSDFAAQESPGRAGEVVQPAPAPGPPPRPVLLGHAQSPPRQPRCRAPLRSREGTADPPAQPRAHRWLGEAGDWGTKTAQGGWDGGCQRAPGAAYRCGGTSPGGGSPRVPASGGQVRGCGAGRGQSRRTPRHSHLPRRSRSAPAPPNSKS